MLLQSPALAPDTPDTKGGRCLIWPAGEDRQAQSRQRLESEPTCVATRDRGGPVPFDRRNEIKDSVKHAFKAVAGSPFPPCYRLWRQVIEQGQA